jgi:hypothetical protein
MHSREDDPGGPATARPDPLVDPELATLLRYGELLEHARSVAARIDERVRQVVAPRAAVPTARPCAHGQTPAPRATVGLAKALIARLLQGRPETRLETHPG